MSQAVKNRTNDAALLGWLNTLFPDTKINLVALANDASTRRYYRINGFDQSYILMDASNEQAHCRDFVVIAGALKTLGLSVPKVVQQDLQQGFLLLSDLGDERYDAVLNSENADKLYEQAMHALATLQTCPPMNGYALPKFAPVICRCDLELFLTQFLEGLLGLSFTVREVAIINNFFDKLTHFASQQDPVCMHRDYHSRNLMVLSDKNTVGILDFQNLMQGPVTYDLVSLLRDCYLDWPTSNVDAWVSYFYANCLAKRLKKNLSFDAFKESFDIIGIQRHCKALGTFALKARNEGRDEYLAFVPRTLHYLKSALSQHASTEVNRLFDERLLPAWEQCA